MKANTTTFQARELPCRLPRYGCCRVGAAGGGVARGGVVAGEREAAYAVPRRRRRSARGAATGGTAVAASTACAASACSWTECRLGRIYLNWPLTMKPANLPAPKEVVRHDARCRDSRRHRGRDEKKHPKTKGCGKGISEQPHCSQQSV